MPSPARQCGGQQIVRHQRSFEGTKHILYFELPNLASFMLLILVHLRGLLPTGMIKAVSVGLFSRCHRVVTGEYHHVTCHGVHKGGVDRMAEI